jgi:hypothetical protein
MEEGKQNRGTIFYMYREFINERKNTKLSFKEFREIVYLFNRLAMTEVIETGKSLDLGYHLGSLSVNKVKRRVRKSINGNYYTSINWGESNKLKKQILEEGKVPLQYLKDDRGVIIGDNGGVPWQIYHTDEYSSLLILIKHKIKLDGSNKLITLIKNYDHYVFKPSFDNRISLQKFNKENNVEYHVL